MVDDIFELNLNFELPSGAASCRLFYVQTVDHGPLDPKLDPVILTNAFEQVVHGALLAMLADDVRCPSVTARHVFRDNGDAYRVTYERSTALKVGTEPGPSLPNNLAILCTLGQLAFSKRTKGRFFIPGIPEAQSDRNIVSAGFLNGPVQSFLDVLFPPLVDPSDGGEWKLAVRSHKLFYAPVQAWIDGGEVGPRPDPDWAGSVTPANSISVQPPISPMKRRATKVFGRAA